MERWCRMSDDMQTTIVMKSPQRQRCWMYVEETEEISTDATFYYRILLNFSSRTCCRQNRSINLRVCWLKQCRYGATKWLLVTRYMWHNVRHRIHKIIIKTHGTKLLPDWIRSNNLLYEWWKQTKISNRPLFIQKQDHRIQMVTTSHFYSDDFDRTL